MFKGHGTIGFFLLLFCSLSNLSTWLRQARARKRTRPRGLYTSFCLFLSHATDTYNKEKTKKNPYVDEMRKVDNVISFMLNDENKGG